MNQPPGRIEHETTAIGHVEVQPRQRQVTFVLQLAFVLLIVGVYTLMFFPVYRLTGSGMTSALGIIPVVATAWFWGLRAGLLAGLLGALLNALLMHLVIPSALDTVVQALVVSAAVNLPVGAVIGRLRDLGERLKREIVERKQTEEALRQSQTRLKLLNSVPTRIISGMSVEQVIELTIKQLGRYFPDFRVAYSTIDPQGKIMVLKSLEPPGMPAMTGLETDLNAAPDYLGDLLKGVPVITQDIFQDPRTAPLAEAIAAGNTRAVLDVPLIHSDALVGLLCFDSPECRQWSEHEIATLKETAEYLSIALKDAQIQEERKQAEEALQKSEERFRSLSASSPVGIFQTDEAGKAIYLNDSLLFIFGQTLEECLGYGWHNGVHPEDRVVLLDKTSRAVREGRELKDEYRVVKPGGEVRWVSAYSAPMHADDGRVLGRVGTLIDITERKRMEEALQQRTTQLEALRAVGLELTAQLDLDALLHAIVSRAMELLGGSGGGLCLYRPVRDVLEVVTILGDTPMRIGRIFRQSEGLSGKVWETGKPVIVDDYGHWEGRAAAWESRPPIAVLGVPIRWGEEFLGVLLVRSPSPRIFSPADAELLSMLATQAAIAIENARLYTQTQQDAETKAMLLHEVNHRVKNNLAAIIGLLYVEKRHAGLAENGIPHEAMLDDMINRIQGLATVHSLLSASEWSSLLLSDVANQVIYSALQLLPPDKDIAVAVTLAQVRVMPAQASSLALVINELATNTVKYALPAVAERYPPRITVHIGREDDLVLFEFQDNGPGYPEEILRLERYNIGMYLIQNIVQEQLHGDLTFHNDQGAVTTIRFKAVG